MNMIKNEDHPDNESQKLSDVHVRVHRGITYMHYKTHKYIRQNIHTYVQLMQDKANADKEMKELQRKLTDALQKLRTYIHTLKHTYTCTVDAR